MERQVYLFGKEEPELLPNVGEALLAPVYGVQLTLKTEMIRRQVYLLCKEEPELIPNVGEALLAPFHGIQLVDRHHQLGHTQGPNQYRMLPKGSRYSMIDKTKHARKTSHPKTNRTHQSASNPSCFQFCPGYGLKLYISSFLKFL